MDLEEAMEFILDQQAKFWAGLEETRRDQAEFRREQAELRREQTDLRRDQTDLQGLVVRIAAQQLELTQHVGRFQQEISAAVLSLAEAQKHGDERLNALIAVVDGVVRPG